MEIQIGDVGHIIQLAIAPVFLLTGVGTNLIVLTNRLARIIDRSRVLEERAQRGLSREGDEDEIRVLYRRAYLVNGAITLSTTCALFICVVIAALFLWDAFRLSLAFFIAVLFVLAMLALIGSFVYLLQEVFFATSTLSLRRRRISKT